MTCKDCIHFEVCDSGRHIGEYIEDDGVYTEGVENECETFKNKADFMEVVRCEKCFKAQEMGERWGEQYKYFCKRHHSYVLANDFCSYGEKNKRTILRSDT